MQEQEICNFVKKHLQEFRKGVGDPVRPGPITQRLVGQGPCALPGVRYKAGRRGEGTPPYGGLQGARKNERGRTPPLRGAYKECGKAGRRGRRPLRVVTRGAGRAESPGHGFAVTVPFRQGAKGTGDADCHSQCAHWLRNDTLLEIRYKPGGRTEASAPTGGLHEVPACGPMWASAPTEGTWGAVNGPPGICRRGPPFGFLGKKIPASKAGSILPYYGGGDNARKKFAGGEILSHTMIFF